MSYPKRNDDIGMDEDDEGNEFYISFREVHYEKFVSIMFSISGLFIDYYKYPDNKDKITSYIFHKSRDIQEFSLDDIFNWFISESNFFSGALFASAVNLSMSRTD